MPVPQCQSGGVRGRLSLGRANSLSPLGAFPQQVALMSLMGMPGDPFETFSRNSQGGSRLGIGPDTQTVVVVHMLTVDWSNAPSADC